MKILRNHHHRHNYHKYVKALAVFVSALGLGFSVAGHAEHHDRGSAAEILAVEHASIPLTTAISTAESSVAGQAIRAETEVRHEKSRYEVAIATEKGIAKVEVDLATGKVVDTYEPGFFDRLFDREGKNKAEVAATLPINLLDAVMKAEKEAGGKAIKARLKTKGETPHYLVGVAVGTTVKLMSVDAKSGAIAEASRRDRDHDEDRD